MKIIVNYDLCESNAICMDVAPEIFEVRDDDLLYLTTETPGSQHHQLVKLAAERCPKQALTIEG